MTEGTNFFSKENGSSDKLEKFRITFNCGPTSGKRYSVDVMAKDSDEAFRMAYKMPQVKSGEYSGIGVMKVPEKLSKVGIEFVMYDSYFKKNFTNYVILDAESEEEARKIYMEKFYGQHFWFNPGEINPEGKNIYKEIKETYIVA